jgi:hypothetical protein
VLAIVGGIFALGAFLAGLGREGPLSVSFLFERAWHHAGALALVSGLGVLAQAGAAVLVLVLGNKLVASLALAPPADDIASLGLVAVALGIVLALGVVRDLACVAAVRGGHGFYVATSRALHCTRQAGGRAFFAWAWRAALGTAGVGLAAWLAPSGAAAGAAAVAVAAVMHQGAILGTTFAHASWLAAAMRLYDATATTTAKAEPPLEETAEPAPAESPPAEPAPADHEAAEPAPLPAEPSAEPPANA